MASAVGSLDPVVDAGVFTLVMSLPPHAIKNPLVQLK
jgi:hypothetical protein